MYGFKPLPRPQAKLDKELGGIMARLNNPAFMAKASPEVRPGRAGGEGACTGAGQE